MMASSVVGARACITSVLQRVKSHQSEDEQFEPVHAVGSKRAPALARAFAGLSAMWFCIEETDVVVGSRAAVAASVGAVSMHALSFASLALF